MIHSSCHSAVQTELTSDINAHLFIYLFHGAIETVVMQERQFRWSTRRTEARKLRSQLSNTKRKKKSGVGNNLKQTTTTHNVVVSILSSQ